MRDIVRMVFFVPHDHFDIAVGVTHALDSYVRAVNDCPDALVQYTCCDWEPAPLNDRGCELIRATLNPRVRHFAEDYMGQEVSADVKDGAEPFFGLYGKQDSGFSFEYHARTPWREEPVEAVSVLRATLPTEYLDERGASAVSELAIALASRLPLASGHAGLALEVAPPQLERLDVLRPLLSRHPGFDVRDAGILDEVGFRIDGVHWMNFLGPPVLTELGGAAGLRARLRPTLGLQALGDNHALVTLGPEPDAGDLLRGETLTSYREFAHVLEPWLEPFAWGHLDTQGKAADAVAWRTWWHRFRR
ncbi:type VI immunity family protein [Archangium primigenium]|uniref:type VI immunity family protein n=1 Tax=[Archangium] primigenium TaxID=2792470 RepID=UPI001956A3E8|nr:DUF3396 domain-containing protein [Archangium primigenium]